MIVTRRAILLAAAGASLPSRLLAASLPSITVTKDPSCGCCSAWAEHLRTNAFPVTLTDTPQINRVKVRLGVPQDLWSCHTGEVAGYVIEGHVPALAITRLLREKPRAKGLAVPGMPVGSPGMEVEGAPPEEYEVILFGPSGRRTYARFRGGNELKL